MGAFTFAVADVFPLFCQYAVPDQMAVDSLSIQNGLQCGVLTALRADKRPVLYTHRVAG